jgi:uncharacterized coiled-coil protein SlyX
MKIKSSLLKSIVKEIISEESKNSQKVEQEKNIRRTQFLLRTLSNSVKEVREIMKKEYNIDPPTQKEKNKLFSNIMAKYKDQPPINPKHLLDEVKKLISFSH